MAMKIFKITTKYLNSIETLKVIPASYRFQSDIYIVTLIYGKRCLVLNPFASWHHLQAFAYTRSANCLWTFARLQYSEHREVWSFK